MVEYLSEHKEKGYHVYFESDEDGQLSIVFMEMPGAREHVAQGDFGQSGERALLALFDTTVSDVVTIAPL
jgi:hypothetical protein